MGRTIGRVRGGGEHETRGKFPSETVFLDPSDLNFYTTWAYYYKPAIKLLDFMRSLAESDEAIRRQDLSLATADEEALGFASFVTEVARRVSKTMRALEPLSAVDAERWVDYWASAGMFSEGVQTD